MPDKIDKDALAQRWVHSHEEDSDREMVFRPANFAFPPSRGRVSFELRADGGLQESVIGPADRSEHAQGSWRLDDTGNLSFFHGLEEKPSKVLRLKSADRNRMVVKK